MTIDPRERLILAFILAFAGCLMLVSELQADATNPRRTTIPYHLSDTKPRLYVVNGQKYAIQKNFVPTPPEKNGTTTSVSMRAFYPDISGLTEQDVPCLDFRSSCYDRGIIIGLGKGEFPTGTARLKNIRGILQSDKKVGKCNFEYYESIGHPATRAIYFLIPSRDNSNISLLRCFTYNSKLRGLCNSYENIDDGNYFYYVFSSSKLCDWPEIRNRIFDRIVFFKKAAEELDRK